jgi:hypothetical protein
MLLIMPATESSGVLAVMVGEGAEHRPDQRRGDAEGAADDAGGHHDRVSR